MLKPVGAKIGAKLWQSKGSNLAADKGGRPKGCFRISDRKLRELLDSESAPRSEWSVKVGGPKRALTASKRQVWIRNPRLARLISYRVLCRRLARGRLGIGVCKNQTDKCEYCHWFDSVDRKYLHTLLADFRNFSSALVGSFWFHFDLAVATNPSYTVDGFIPEAIPSCLLDVARHVERTSKEHASADGLGERAAALLHALREDDGGYIQKIEGINGHLKLRDAQQAAYKVDKNEPREERLYLHWEFLYP